jgi:hypothetical protein
VHDARQVLEPSIYPRVIIEDDYSTTARSLLVLVSGSRYIPSAKLPEYSLVKGVGGSPIRGGGSLLKWRLEGVP